MKILQLILILAIIGICVPEEVDCGSLFQAKLREKCSAIGSCELNELSNDCTKTKECTKVNVNNEHCATNVPPNFKVTKCKLNTEETACISTPRLCSDYNPVYDNTLSNEENCTNLIPETN